MALNIKTRAAKNTSTFQLLDGNDEPLFDLDAEGRPTVPVKVTVYGPGSKEFQRAQARANNRNIDLLKKKGKADQSADEKVRQTAEHLADITVNFENLDYDGLAGRELALAVYSDTSLGFIADQVNKHAGDWANFTTGSSKS